MKNKKKDFNLFAPDEVEETILKLEKEDALILAKEEAICDKFMTGFYIVGIVSMIIVIGRNLLMLWSMI